MAQGKEIQHFLSLQEEVLRPWREHPVTESLIAWLREGQEAYLFEVARCVGEGRVDDARVAQGRQAAVSHLLLAVASDRGEQPPRAAAEDAPVDDLQETKRRTSANSKQSRPSV